MLFRSEVEEVREDAQDETADLNDDDAALEPQEDTGAAEETGGRQLEDDVGQGQNLDLDEDMNMTDGEKEDGANMDDLDDMPDDQSDVQHQDSDGADSGNEEATAAARCHDAPFQKSGTFAGFSHHLKGAANDSTQDIAIF